MIRTIAKKTACYAQKTEGKRLTMGVVGIFLLIFSVGLAWSKTKNNFDGKIKREPEKIFQVGSKESVSNHNKEKEENVLGSRTTKKEFSQGKKRPEGKLETDLVQEEGSVDSHDVSEKETKQSSPSNPAPTAESSDIGGDIGSGDILNDTQEDGQTIFVAPTSTPTPTQSPTPTQAQTPAPTQTPTPTPAVTPSVLPEPTPTPISPSTPTPSLVVTSAPTPTPTPSIPTETKEIMLFPAASATPNADGKLSVTAVKYDHGYWDFDISGNFRFLQPNRIYQLWLCNINCSSHGDAKFMTDNSGSASISGVVINHAQLNDPVSRVAVWEVPPRGEIIEDPTTCYFLSINSVPCLEASLHF